MELEKKDYFLENVQKNKKQTIKQLIQILKTINKKNKNKHTEKQIVAILIDLWLQSFPNFTLFRDNFHDEIKTLDDITEINFRNVLNKISEKNNYSFLKFKIEDKILSPFESSTQIQNHLLFQKFVDIKDLENLARLLDYKDEEIGKILFHYKSTKNFLQNDPQKISQTIQIEINKIQSLQKSLIWYNGNMPLEISVIFGKINIELFEFKFLSESDLKEIIQKSNPDIPHEFVETKFLNSVLSFMNSLIPDFLFDETFFLLLQSFDKQIFEIAHEEKIFGINAFTKDFVDIIVEKYTISSKTTLNNLDSLISLNVYFESTSFLLELTNNIKISIFYNVITIKIPTEQISHHQSHKIKDKTITLPDGKNLKPIQKEPIKIVGPTRNLQIDSLHPWWNSIFLQKNEILYTPKNLIAHQDDLTLLHKISQKFSSNELSKEVIHDQLLKIEKYYKLQKSKEIHRYYNDSKNSVQQRIEKKSAAFFFNKKLLTLGYKISPHPTLRKAWPWLKPIQPTKSRTLRTLMFAGDLSLTQELVHRNNNGVNVTYNLNSPCRSLDAECDFTGWIIVAENIILTEDIHTNGHDLVLIANNISVDPTISNVIVDSHPILTQPQASENSDGKVSKHGGDVCFIVKNLSNSNKIQVISSGEDGQQGGNGSDFNQLSSGRLDVTHEQQMISGPTWDNDDTFFNRIGLKTGIQFKFNFGNDRSSSGGTGNSSYRLIDMQANNSNTIRIRAGRYSDVLESPPIIIPTTGTIDTEYGIVNGFQESARNNIFHADIPDSVFPKPGAKGSYGGSPGQISLIIPPGTPISGSLSIVSQSGLAGLPGNGGNGGIISPSSVRIEGSGDTPLTADFIHKWTIQDKPTVLRFADNGYDRFSPISTSPGDDFIKKSLIAVKFEAALNIKYFSSSTAKSNNIESDKSLALARLDQVKIGKIRKLRKIHNQRFWYNESYWTPNKYPYNSNTNSDTRPDAIELTIHNGLQGEVLLYTPPIVRDLSITQNNWYQTVYDLVPDYPVFLADLADKEFRSGNFHDAHDLYDEVINFSNQSDFYSPDLVAAAEFMVIRGSSGLDYLGFNNNELIPKSPKREIELLDTYIDTVTFFNTSIRQRMISRDITSSSITILNQFKVNHEALIEKTTNAINSLNLEITALTLEMEAKQQEIDATIQHNIRLNQILISWINKVEAKIEKLKQDLVGENHWYDIFVDFWNLISPIIAIISSLVSFGAGIANIAQAFNKVSEFNTDVRNLGALVDGYLDTNWDELDPETGSLLQRLISDSWTQVKESGGSLFGHINTAFTKISEAKDYANQLGTSFSTMSNMSNSWTSQEAIDFKQDALDADEIGVSGGINYLEISEQIQFNSELLVAKRLELEANITRRLNVMSQISSLTHELISHHINSNYLRDMITHLQNGSDLNDVHISQLKKAGQESLDTLMHRIQTHLFEFRYLDLDYVPQHGPYNRFVENDTDVGDVLIRANNIQARVQSWIVENSETTSLRVNYTKTDNPEVGSLNITNSELISNFQQGSYLRPSDIIKIEPLLKTEIIDSLSNALKQANIDTNSLLNVLQNLFPNENSNPFLGTSLIDRERQDIPVIDTLSSGILDDLGVVLAYSFAKAGITPSEMNSLIQHIAIPIFLKDRLLQLFPNWDPLRLAIMNDSSKSIRKLSEFLRKETFWNSNIIYQLNDRIAFDDSGTIKFFTSIQNSNINNSPISSSAFWSEETFDNAAKEVLLNYFVEGGSIVSIDKFRLYTSDIQIEIDKSFDPNYSTETILGEIHNNDDINVALVISLLYGNIDTVSLTNIRNTFSPTDPLGDKIGQFILSWTNLQRSILEKIHSFIINLDLHDILSVPNMNFSRMRRFLDAGIQIHTNSNVLNVTPILRKLPVNEFQTINDDIIQITLPEEEKIVSSVINSRDLTEYHFKTIFGRSILGKFEVILQNNGTNPPLGEIEKITSNFLFLYRN